MALILYQQFPLSMAPKLCNPLAASITIGAMLLKSRTSPDCAHILYDSTVNASRGGSGEVWDLAKHCYLVFAKNKRTLERGLEYQSTTAARAPDGYMSIVKNNYSGFGIQYGGYLTLPLNALYQKIKADWAILQRAGGLFRERTNELYDMASDTTTIVKSQPLEYTSYAYVANSIRRVNASRSGYYVLICQSRDIVDDYDIMGKRCYTIQQRTIKLPAISTLINT